MAKNIHKNSGSLEQTTLFKRFLIALTLLCEACTVGPNYHPPEHQVPCQWHNVPPNSNKVDPTVLANWWKLFNDQTLNSLIQRALHCNNDIKAASARVREARALYRIQEANLWPNISGQAFYTREQFSNNAIAAFLPGVQGQQPGSTTPRGISFSRGQNLFQATFDMTWEIDLFGGIYRGVQAQYALYGAAIWDWRGVTVSLLGELARNYMELRGAQQQIVVAKNNVSVQQNTLKITQQRLEAGLATSLDVTRAQSQLSTTESLIPIFQYIVKKSIHRISILLGLEPGALYSELCSTELLPCNPPLVPTGIPAQLLCRRPDIKRAERSLAAASAEIGVAEAQLYPQLTLAGDIGYQSSNFGNLFTGGSNIYSIGPIINIPIFNGGALIANVKANKAKFQEQLYLYRQTVLVALEEVENALVAYLKGLESYHLLFEAHQANLQSVKLSQEQYQKGLVDFLNVLSAEKDLFNSEIALTLSRTMLSVNLVTLYKALGGGWECEETIHKKNKALLINSQINQKGPL